MACIKDTSMRQISISEILRFDLQNLPDDFAHDPFAYYAAMVRYAPVLAQEDGSFILSAHADLDRVYRDTLLFSSDKKATFGPKFGRGPLFEHHTTSLVFNDPPLHTRVRKIMVGAMSPRAIAGMEPGLIAVVDRLLDALDSTGEVDLIDAFAASIPIQIIGNLFDIPLGERAPLRDWSLAILGALEPVPSPDQLALGHRAVAEFKAYLRQLADHRRANPGDPQTDVLTRLIRGEDGDLSEVELLQNCIFILNAGHETTTNLIGNALAALDANPEQKQALIDSPDLIHTGVDEFLRYLSPNQFGNRQTAADTEIGGISLAKATNLHLCIGAANRDPTVFDAPHVLNLARRPNKHFAFAGGPHTCVGMSLARMEGRVALTRFLRRYPDYHLTGTPVQGGRVRFRGYAHLPARLS
jgi:cytochrome P450